MSNPRPDTPSDHFDGKRFFNPGVDTDKTLADMRRWRREGGGVPWPPHLANRAFPPPPDHVEAGSVAITFVGQATMLIRTADCTVLTDPFFSDRASPLSFAGPRRVRAPGLPIEALPPLDAILLSHNHYDHMDLASLRALRRRTEAPILTGLGNAAYLARRGVPGAVDLDWWEEAPPLPGLRVTYVPAQHWSMRAPWNRRRMLWGGFVLQSAGATIYFAGDSGYCPWFRAIGERLGPPDVALLPIGAYEPRWFMGSQHMNPADAVQAHRDLGARRSIGMHFGTIRLTDEAIDEPIHALARARAEAGLDDQAFTTLDIGETTVIRLG